MKVLILLASFALVLMPRAADESEAREILHQVAATYRSLESFSWSALPRQTSPRYTTYFDGEFLRGVGMRIHQHINPQAEEVRILDGKSFMLLYPGSQRYCRRPYPAEYLEASIRDGMTQLSASLPYERIDENFVSARLLGDRVLKIGGETVSCRVLSVRYKPDDRKPITFWVDSGTNVVVQHTEATETWTLLRYKLNPNLSTARFHFRPAGEEIKGSCIGGGGG